MTTAMTSGRESAPSPPGPDEQGLLLAEALGTSRLDLFLRGGETTTFAVHGTDLLATVAKGWPAEVTPAARLEREAGLLARVGSIVRVPVPVVEEARVDIGCAVVRRLPGTPLLERPARERAAAAADVAATLGTLLGDLHSADPADFLDLVGNDDVTPAEWREETAGTAHALDEVLGDARRADVRAFLERRPPAPASVSVLSHADLGIEHVLVSGVPGRPVVTGVIDWADAAVTDPALDFGRLLRDLGPRAYLRAVAAYRLRCEPDAGFDDRARYYAACMLLEDLAFGHQHGRPAYVDKSMAGWDHLLGAG